MEDEDDAGGGEDMVVLLQIVDRENEPADAPFLAGWEARRLPVVTVTSDNAAQQHCPPFRISFRGCDPLSKVQSVVSILLGGSRSNASSRDKTFVLGSTPVQNSITWVCYWGQPLARVAASSGAEQLSTSAPSNGKGTLSTNTVEVDEGGAFCRASITGGGGISLSTSSLAAAPEPPDDCPELAANMLAPANNVAEQEEKIQKTSKNQEQIPDQEMKQKQQEQDSDCRVRLLSASGDGYSVNINGTTSYPLTIPCSLPIAEAEKLLRASVFGGQEVRLLPVELEIEPESEEGGSSVGDATMRDLDGVGRDGGKEHEAKDDEMQNENEQYMEDDASPRPTNFDGGVDDHEDEDTDSTPSSTDTKIARGPLVSSLIVVDRHTGERRLEATLVFPPGEPEPDSDTGDDEHSQDFGLNEKGLDENRHYSAASDSDSHSCSSEEEEENVNVEGAPYTTENIVRSLERALGGEGRPAVGEWVVDLPAAPVVHLPKSGEEYTLIGRESAHNNGSDIKGPESADELAAEQRARLGPLLDSMKSIDPYAKLNEYGDSILRPGLFSINKAERAEARNARHFFSPGSFSDYERGVEKKRMSFCKSLSANQVEVTAGGVDILKHLISANLPGRIQMDLETGYPVDIQFERLDAGGCCAYMDKLRKERAETRRKIEAEDAKNKKAEEPFWGMRMRRRYHRKGGRWRFDNDSTSESSSDEGEAGAASSSSTANGAASSVSRGKADGAAAAVPDVAVAPVPAFEGEHWAEDPGEKGDHSAMPTWQRHDNSSSSSSGCGSAATTSSTFFSAGGGGCDHALSTTGGPFGPAVASTSSCTTEEPDPDGDGFKSDDEDAAYERISRDVVRRREQAGEGGIPAPPLATDDARDAAGPSAQANDLPRTHPGRLPKHAIDESGDLVRLPKDFVFTPRTGRWSALFTESDAEILRRRDDERGRTVGTLLVSVQGPWTESKVSTSVSRGGETQTITLAPGSEAHGAWNQSGGRRFQVRCAAVIRGLDVADPVGLGNIEGDDSLSQRGHAFVLVYRVVRSRRVPILDRQQILADLQRSGRLPVRPVPDPNPDDRNRRVMEMFFPPPGVAPRPSLEEEYAAALKKAVKAEESERLWSRGVFEAKSIRRDENWRFRNKKWLLADSTRAPGYPDPLRRRREDPLSHNATVRLAARLASVLSRGWASAEFMPTGGALLLPHYEVYGARELHPLRSESLSKPLQRGLPDNSAARALNLAARYGTAKLVRPVKALRNNSAATAASAGSTAFCYEDVDVFCETRLCILGAVDEGLGTRRYVRGRDLVFRETVPPFRFRSRLQDEAEEAFGGGDGATAAALLCGGPLTYADGEAVVPTDEHSRADEIEMSSSAGSLYPDASRERDRLALLGVKSFTEKLIALSGGGVAQAHEDGTSAALKVPGSGAAHWLKAPNSKLQDRTIKTLRGPGRDMRLETFRAPPSSERGELSMQLEDQGSSSALGPADTAKETSRARINIGLASVVKIVVPPYEKRGFLPVDFETRSRTVVDELFEVHGRGHTTKEEFVARQPPELRTLKGFCKDVEARVDVEGAWVDRIDPRHRSPVEVRCETLDLLSWFWSSSCGFEKPDASCRAAISGVDGAGSSEDDALGALRNFGNSIFAGKSKRVPKDALARLINGTADELVQENGSGWVVPECLENTCSGAMRRARLRHIVPASSFCWTLVFPSRGVHPNPDRTSWTFLASRPYIAENFADRMCSYRSLLRRAWGARSHGSGSAAHEREPLEIVLSSGLFAAEFRAVASVQDLQLVEAAVRGGAVVKLRWYLQELACYPQKDLPDADPATTIGAQKRPGTYVLDAAPVTNPLARTSDALHPGVPIRELTIRHGMEALRPRRALAVHKPLPSKHIQPIKRDLPSSPLRSSGSLMIVDADPQSTFAAQQQAQLQTVSTPTGTGTTDDTDSSQLEFVAEEGGRAGFSSREELRAFLFNEVGPQYDCTAADDVWVTPLPSKLRWPSPRDLNKKYEKPYHWTSRAVRAGSAEAGDKPPKAERRKHKEEWERSEDLRTRKKVRRTKANLIHFPLAKNEAGERSAVEQAASGSDGNRAKTAPSSCNRCSSKTSPPTTTSATDYRGFYLCAAFHITFPPNQDRWAPLPRQGAATAPMRGDPNIAPSGSSSTAARPGKRTTAEAIDASADPAAAAPTGAQEDGAPPKRSRTIASSDR